MSKRFVFGLNAKRARNNARQRNAPLAAAALASLIATNAAAAEQPVAAQVKWQGAHSAEVTSTASRLTISQSQRLGGEVVSAFKHINANSLSPGATWRSEIDATFAGFESDQIETEFRIGAFDTRRPVVRTRGGFGLEDFNLWRSNSVVDFGFALSAFDGRLRYASGAASSETGLQNRYTEEPWLWAFEPGGGARDYLERSTAIYQKLEANIVDKQAFKLSLSALYSNAGQDFRSFQTNTLADIYYEGESLNATAFLRSGKTSVSFEKDAHSDRFYAFDENTLRVERGAVNLKLTVMQEETREAALTFYSDEIVRGRLEFDLKKMFSDAPAWLPESLSFGASERASRKPTLYRSEDAVRRSFGVGATKAGDHYSTDIYVYWNERNDMSEIGGFEAANEFGVDLVQSFFSDDWDFSLYAMMSDMSRQRRFARDGDEKLLSGGVSFSKSFERAPDIRFNLDAFRFDAGSVYDDYAFESHDLTLRVEADVSEQLLSGLGYDIDERRPYSVYLGVYNGWSMFDDSLSPTARDSETRLLIMLRRGM